MSDEHAAKLSREAIDYVHDVIDRQVEARPVTDEHARAALLALMPIERR